MPRHRHHIPSLEPQELDAELRRISGSGAKWRHVAFALADLRELEIEYQSIPSEERTLESLQLFASQAFELALVLTDALYVKPSDRQIIQLLMHLDSALEDLTDGLNSRLLVTGNLAELIPSGRYSGGSHRRIRALAAAIVEFMLSNKVETSQSKAAARIADTLNKGGYVPPGEFKAGHTNRADTVKRWHNSALKGHRDLTIFMNDEFQWLKQRHTSSGRPSQVIEEAMIELLNMCEGYRLVDK